MEKKRVLLTNSDSELYIKFDLFQSFLDEIQSEINPLDFGFFASLDRCDLSEFFDKVRDDEIVVSFFLEYGNAIFDDDYTEGNIFTVPDEADEYFIIPTDAGDYICTVTHSQYGPTTYDTFNYEGEKGNR